MIIPPVSPARSILGPPCHPHVLFWVQEAELPRPDSWVVPASFLSWPLGRRLATRKKLPWARICPRPPRLWGGGGESCHILGQSVQDAYRDTLGATAPDRRVLLIAPDALNGQMMPDLAASGRVDPIEQKQMTSDTMPTRWRMCTRTTAGTRCGDSSHSIPFTTCERGCLVWQPCATMTLSCLRALLSLSLSLSLRALLSLLSPSPMS